MNPGLTRPLKVNDMVYSKRLGYGQVEQVNQRDTYPYIVRFKSDEDEIRQNFSEKGQFRITKTNANIDLAGPLRKDGTIKPNKPNELIKTVQTIAVKNKENGHQEGTIIDIDGCKIFRSGDSMIILPQNDDLWLKQQFSFQS